MIPN